MPVSERQSPVWQVRPAGEEDAEALAALHADSFGDPWSKDEWRRYISEMSRAEPQISEAQAASVLVLIGYDAGQNAGALAGMVLARRTGDEAEILTIAVARAHRQQGLARQLLAALLEVLGAALPCRLYLEVSIENTQALGLYKAFGFRPVGRRAGYYRSAGGKLVDAKILALNLPSC